MGLISNCCNKVKKDKKYEEDIHQTIDDIKFERGNFMAMKNERFKDNYNIGKSMGCSIYGEVRVC